MRQDYIKMRKSNKLDIVWFFNYFRENGGSNLNLNEFYHIFVQYIDRVGINSIWLFFDNLYNITLIEYVKEKKIEEKVILIVD